MLQSCTLTVYARLTPPSNKIAIATIGLSDAGAISGADTSQLDFRLIDSRPAPALPDGFLGGSAPRLQSLELDSIPFPALPKLLLSATDLVHLTLWNIPHSGYISPEAIVTGLAVLANLKSLTIEFESPLSRPDRESRRPPPPTRTVLPALTRFEFQGVSEYLETSWPGSMPLCLTPSV